MSQRVAYISERSSFAGPGEPAKSLIFRRAKHPEGSWCSICSRQKIRDAVEVKKRDGNGAFHLVCIRCARSMAKAVSE